VPDDLSLHFGDGDFTIEAWIRLDNAGSTYDLPVLFKGQSSTIAYYSLQIVLGTRQPQFTGSSNNIEWNATSSDPITLNEWHHLAGVRSGAVFTLYVDGIQKAQVTLAVGSTDTSNPLDIGYWPYGVPTRYFPGDIDEVRAWSGARSAAEIAENKDVQLVGNEPGLVGLWQFNSCQGSQVNDLSLSDNNGTLFGSYTYVTDVWLPSSGTGDYANMGSSNLLLPSILTCEAWVWVDSIHDATSMLIVSNAKDFHGYRLFLSDGRPAFDCQNGTYHVAISPTVLPINEWHHLLVHLMDRMSGFGLMESQRQRSLDLCRLQHTLCLSALM